MISHRQRSLIVVAVTGVLSLLAGLAGWATPTAQAAPPPDFTYVEVDDGTLISISVAYPEGFDPDAPDGGQPGGWPTLFQMDGYAGGGSALTGTVGAYGDKYVAVYASIRGTGCSGGRFDLFDRRHAEDGKYIIDEWIAQQPWSNGEIGIIGHSYPGLTGWLVASTQPEELDAIAISGLIDDLYRGIVYPGGVGNYGFPAFWTGAYRPAVEVAGNGERLGTETTSGDPTCAANIATRTADPSTVNGLPDNPIVQGLTSPEDDTWYDVRSTDTYVPKINKPIHLTQQWQDEQTGPRGSNVLWERLEETSPDLPKRMVLVNGVHSTTSVGFADRAAWLDCWLIHDGEGCGDVTDPTQRVRVHFEESDGGGADNPAYVSSDWPLPETEWTRFYLQPDGSLGVESPPEGSATATYVSTPQGRQTTDEVGTVSTGGQLGTATFSNGPDQLRYSVAFDQDTAVAGPIALTLTAASTAVDTDFFVDVVDIGPGGEVSYLQRGVLRASHRQVDPRLSDTVASGPEAGAYYRPHHPHTNTTGNLLTPGEPTQLEIEVFPVGHVFRAGHQLAIQLHAPPAKDPISIYAWVSHRTPAVNIVHHGPVGDLAASSILVPVVPGPVPVSAEPPPCGGLVGIPCFTPLA